MTSAVKPLLSICIPTYNRAALLRAAIDSVLQQADSAMADLVEIIVSNNASSDDTESVAKKLVAESILPIKYFKNEKNVGFDGNCLLSVERASGQFIWLLGDDDLVSPGALKYVLQRLKQKELVDLYFFEKEDFLLVPEQRMRFRRIMPFAKERTFDFRDQKIVDEYFRVNKKLIAYCNFLSNIIFRREKWEKVKDKELFVGTAYIHLYVFQSMLWGSPGVMKYWPQPIVKRRWGNDGSVEPEMRLRQDVLMFHKIAAAVFPDKKYVYLIDDMVIRNDGYSWAVRIKINNPRRYFTVILPFLFTKYWDHPIFWFKLVSLAFFPNFVLRFMRGFYRRQIKGESLSLREMLAG